ncbi:MAG: pyruvate:ferredoxin (flavodoxin) oxidoreductase [bacterium]|nr:pyruvate:ferredoxin (flavodoxin) oxidoreductase [bacterium]
MNKPSMTTIDGNEAAASVAYRTNEVIAIYPITPASPMGELADAWSVEKRQNVWGQVPDVVEMQSEGGAAGAVHGAIQAGSLGTSFTASQGLLLKIPNMYKIAGELTPFVLHVAARTLATHALSIFCDHSDVMAARQTGFAFLVSGSVQEAHDMAAIAQAATLESRVPFLHFFDGFRTSHEIQKIAELSDAVLREMIDLRWVEAHRARALTPDSPVLRGTAQNPDAFFQAREACNGFYDACPGIVRSTMARFAELTGRQYDLFEYAGHPEAERVLVLMGSGAETAHETMARLAGAGEKVGVLKVRLYRPFDVEAFARALPATVRSLAVLDRTKEPGAVGDPLYLDVIAATREAENQGVAPWSESPSIVAGRYGLSSKEFDPACVESVLRELAAPSPRNHFTVGIVDDVTQTSLEVSQEGDVPADEKSVRAIFFGLGSDGTVSANKNSIKIIGENTDKHVQGYFVYDSKKAGAITVSHLRFGDLPIRSAYLVRQAQFVACHQFDFLERFDVLERASHGATFLLNSPHAADQVWDWLPREVQETIIEKDLVFWVIDAYGLARELGLGGRVNTIMQACFFALTDILPRDEALAEVKKALEKSYGKRGPVLVEKNFRAVDAAVTRLYPVEVPPQATAKRGRPPIVATEAPDFVQKVTSVMLAGKGDLLPVSAFPVDGTWQTGTTQWEKRNIAQEIPIWDPKICIQCNHCVLVCPHAAIRSKVFEAASGNGGNGGIGDKGSSAPDSFQSVPYKAKEFKGLQYSLQVAPEDCTGCHLCVEVCPAKDKASPKRKAINMEEQRPIRDRERENYRYFLDIPDIDRALVQRLDAKGSQFLEPLFEYSGACAGCGETPYVKLMTQLFGDRLLIANATGCSSIYGGNLPTTPFTKDRNGRGPAWSNSLFEDNAEFGLGFRLAVDHLSGQARSLLAGLEGRVGQGLVKEILAAEPDDEAAFAEQRRRVERLKTKLDELAGAAGAAGTAGTAGTDNQDAARLREVCDYLVPKSVWLLGGDGWAYDIGYGGLDHVLSLRRNVNVLVMDTEVYSNTGGQASKATPLGAAAKFAVAGKEIAKKDLGLEQMSYGHVYVASIAFGADMNHAVKALREAEAYPGPSLVIAYSPCIAHGYDLAHGVEHQKMLVDTGIWPLYRYDPRRATEGLPPLKLDSRAPRRQVRDILPLETRFRMVEKLDPARYREFLAESQRQAERRYAIYQQLAEVSVPQSEADAEQEAASTASTASN